MTSAEPQSYEFGEFQLHTAERLLLRRGEAVPLAPKVFDTLVVLVEHNGHLLNKEVLMQELWPDTFVEDVNLSVNISALRKVLGESEAGRAYIHTVAKSGYRFTADVRRLERGAVDSGVSKEPATAIAETSETVPEQLPSIRAAKSVESRKSLLLHKRTLVLVLAFAFVLSAAGIGLYKWRDLKQGSTFESMRIARITNSGKALNAAISPDGKYVAYVALDPGQPSLWLRQVAGSTNLQIGPPGNLLYGGLTFSNDSNFLFYETVDPNGAGGVLYKMPVLGGPSTKLVIDIDSLITPSPDAKRFAFLRGYPADGDNALIVANADGSGERKVAIRHTPDFFLSADASPAWSPDGKVIACPAGSSGPGGLYMLVLEVRVKDGSVRPLTSQRWWRIGRMAWLPDGRGFVFTGQEQESSPSQIWYLPYPVGEVRRITNDLNDYTGVSVTSDGDALVTVQGNLQSSIWTMPAADTKQAREIRSNNFDGVAGMSWMPDGRIVYASRASGHSDIWIMDQDGGNRKQLTADGSNNRWPSVTGDGRYIVFASDRAGGQNIWRIEQDGSNPRQLTTGGSEALPDSSPDGQWVVYRSGLGMHNLFKVRIDGGASVPINGQASARPAISPDGKWIAGAYFGDRDRIKTAIYDFAGGDPVKILDVNSVNFYIRWTPDSHAVAYIDPRRSFNIVSQPIDGGRPIPLTDFQTDTVFGFAWSRDGKQLAVTRGRFIRDVALIKNLR